MTQILKQSTQVDVRVGPFVAVGDGFTPVLTAEVSKMDEAELLLADGAATRAFGQADTGLDFMKITGADGWVDCRLSTTDTATVGTLDIVFQDDSLFLPVHKSFQVVEGLVYDRTYATNATGADTGSISNAVWNSLLADHRTAATMGLHDTGGTADAIWAYSSRVATSVSGNVDGSTASVTLVSPNAVDTGSFTGTAAFANDTGVFVNSIWGATSRVATSVSGTVGSVTGAVGSVTSFALDTGIADTVWKTSTSGYTADTGSVGYAQGRLMAVKGDTGAAHLDAGRLGVTAAASVDTGVVNNAVWNGLRADHVVAGSFGRTLTDSGMVATVVDTGKVSNAVWNTLRADHTVASSFGRTLTDSGMVATVVDTGKVSNAVWDTLLTGSTHNTATSAGRRLRVLETGVVLHSGTLDAAVVVGHNTADLETGVASTVDDFYNHNLIVTTGGTGAGQARMIVDYEGITQQATIAPPWTSAVSTDTTYDVVIGYGHSETNSKTVKVGRVDAATATTLKLDTGTASTVDDFYKYDVVEIDYGTGEGQSRIITSYSGTTFTATIAPPWSVTPDTGSEYIVEEALSVSDLISINGDTGKADNLGRMFADTGTLSLFGTIIADAILDRNMATGTDSEAFNFRTPRGALSVLRNRVELDTGTIVVTKEDDTTVRWSGTTESDTGSDGVKTVDPASA
jgi:hypothetical protein